MRKSNLIIIALFLALIGVGIWVVYYRLAPAPTGKAGTPTEAYEQLYAAVREKNTEKIKKVMSKATIKFAEGVAAQRNIDVSKVLENGLYRSTINEKLPALRDERVKGKWGAVEAFSKKDNRWEDVRFILEDGGWKLAVGEVWSGAFKSPGKSRTVREREISNAAGGGPVKMANVNTNVKPKVITPDANAIRRARPDGKPLPAPPRSNGPAKKNEK